MAGSNAILVQQERITSLLAATQTAIAEQSVLIKQLFLSQSLPPPSSTHILNSRQMPLLQSSIPTNQSNIAQMPLLPLPISANQSNIGQTPQPQPSIPTNQSNIAQMPLLSSSIPINQSNIGQMSQLQSSIPANQSNIGKTSQPQPSIPTNQSNIAQMSLLPSSIPTNQSNIVQMPLLPSSISTNQSDIRQMSPLQSSIPTNQSNIAQMPLLPLPIPAYQSNIGQTSQLQSSISTNQSNIGQTLPLLSSYPLTDESNPRLTSNSSDIRKTSLIGTNQSGYGDIQSPISILQSSTGNSNQSSTPISLLDQTSDMSDSYLLSDEFCDFQDHLLNSSQFQQNAINSTYTPPCVSPEIEITGSSSSLTVSTPTRQAVIPPPFPTPPKLEPVEQVLQDNPGTGVAELRKLATRLAKDAIFGKEEMSRSSLCGRYKTGSLDDKELNYIKAVIRTRVPLMPNVEFEFVWGLCRSSISKCCQTLQNKKGSSRKRL